MSGQRAFNFGGKADPLTGDSLDRLNTGFRPYHDDPEGQHSEDEESPPSHFHHNQSPHHHHSSKTSQYKGGLNVSPGGGGGGGDGPPSFVVHSVPDSSKSRWSHIDDLDSFFKKVYQYHQKSGFKVMMVQVSSNKISHNRLEKINFMFSFLIAGDL